MDIQDEQIPESALEARLRLNKDQDSEQAIQRRLAMLRDPRRGNGVVFIPKSWVDDDPALQIAVQELDWLRVEEHHYEYLP